MLSYVWPIGLVILSNVIYQVMAKSMPESTNPFIGLTVTYVVAAVTCLLLYFVVNKDTNLIQEYSKVNWVPFALGISIVGLEVGYVFAYRAGWPVSTASIVQEAVVAVALLLIGYLVFKEAITWSKAAGILVCLVGLWLINQ